MTTELSPTTKPRPEPVATYGIGSVGDMWVGARPDEKMARALQVIATMLHPGFDVGWTHPSVIMPPGKSKESCILCSAAVRDFMFRIGYRDAVMQPVMYWMDAKTPEGEMLKALGIGDPDAVERPDRFNGHVIVKAGGWLIDTTLYQATPREAWPDFPPMFATTLFGPDSKVEWFGYKALAGHGIIHADSGYHIQWAWLDYPGKTDWRTAPDYREKWRRERVVDLLVKTFKAGRTLDD